MDAERVYNKLEKIDGDVVDIKVTLAALPHTFVPREELDELAEDARMAKRWAIGIGVPTILTVVGILISIL